MSTNLLLSGEKVRAGLYMSKNSFIDRISPNGIFSNFVESDRINFESLKLLKEVVQSFRSWSK